MIEIFPIRYKVISLQVWAIFSQFLMGFHILTLPLIMQQINHYVFLAFFVINLAFYLWAYFRQIETQGLGVAGIFKKFENRKYL